MQSRLSLILIVFLGISCDSDETEPPKAEFSFTSNSDFLVPSLINFKNESTNSKEYTWDFGDGTAISKNINPTHEYLNVGVYTVTLIASNGDLIDEEKKEIEIHGLPNAEFSFTSNNDFLEPSIITFQNNSTNSKSYIWNFGDGQSSTTLNSTHEYAMSGTYSVKLTASNDYGTSDITNTISIYKNDKAQLDKLKNTWVLTSAKNEGTVRTSDFPNLKLNISGTYANNGTYNYSFTGTRPNPSPWPVSGNWKFGADPITELIRDPSTTSEISLAYSLSGTTLEITFDLPNGAAGWAGGTSRIKTINGHWIFVFTKQ